ncbi:type III restriction protein res subunit [Melioribacter roseus P3M-2]|uniref:Type III restriction protein res subunit n=1 Tax=Melioribacter roseus (strain DSM 23840 / JCM 17771 / VKM B-2668 / P3M-2) TaxID=1191523 RepID=I6YS39_MELRP|nr:DEAD/DEAH box helicase family protein [Melioribacter roseus]AFN73367.1 type III restriction protein res subunit [Melioribacter roseus P3M-2]
MPDKEAKSRIKINKLLEEAGWRFFDTEEGKANILLENNVKITERRLNEFGENFERTTNGFVDFLLLDDRGFPLVVLEAKAEDKNPLFGKEQARRYAEAQHCRFVILSNGNIHYFWDLERGNPHIISKLPSLQTIKGYETFKPDRNRLINEIIKDDYIVLTQKPDYKNDPSYIDEQTRKRFIEENKLRFLRKYQLLAITAIQNAVRQGKDRFLFEMATGTGKTLVSAAIIKLFLRTGNARRVLFLVDRLELEDQAYKAFREYLKNDYTTVIYKENRGDWQKAEIVVSTIQTFLSKNRYKRAFSPDDFDLVISDEAHRSIGGNSRAVFEYFIGYKLGLTATPKNYLKNIDISKLGENDPRQLERRLLLDTYKTFGCENGEPTFRYSLIDGVRDGFLVNPIVVDARTEISTQLLSDKGYAVITQTEDGEKVEEFFIHKDFEKKFFSENTNRAFCEAFIKNALRDPISNEIGKTIVYCVSQNHAAKITQILNEFADQMFPGKYQSDFAVQVTSNVPAAQQYAINFSYNNLSGSGNFLPIYKTSKTRVCVTVGMMTTGYDCRDILNLCLMRPIFSATEFIQIKGRGTRKYDFANDITDLLKRNNVGEKQKENYKIFDFFANCEYFEEKFNYDEVLELPRISTRSTGGDDSRLPVDFFETTQPDSILSIEETVIGYEGMKIDRMYFQKFEKKVFEHPALKEYAENDRWNELMTYLEQNILNKPEEYFTLEKLRKSINIDRRITLREIIEKVFGMIPYFKTRDELLDEEFDKFDSRYLPKEEYFEYAKTVFKAYILDAEFRQIIDNGNFALLNVSPYGEAFKRLSPELRKAIPEYIKDFVSLNKFVA